MNRRHFVSAASSAAILAATGRAFAQGAFPSRPVTLLVPQPAGGGADNLCRTLQARMQATLGQPLVIDNRGGAAGNIGTAAGAKAAADGYTLVFVNLSTMALNPYLYANPGFKVEDFAPVIHLASVANLVCVHPDVPAKTMKDFIALAKAQPGKVSYGTAGNGSANHLGGEMLKKMAGIDLMHVPYKGGGPAILAAIAGETNAIVADPSAAIPQVKAGKLRALAVTSAKRARALPDVPTVAESGVAGYEATSWAGLVVPKGTPAAVIARLHEAAAGALRVPEIADKLSGLLYEPVGAGPADFAALIKSENEKWAPLIRQLGMRLD